MPKRLKPLGHIKIVQLQPSGLIIDTPTGSFYDASRRMQVAYPGVVLKLRPQVVSVCWTSIIWTTLIRHTMMMTWSVSDLPLTT